MTGWKSSAGYSDDTALVKLYPPQNHKEAWREEAEERGTSMSQYCQELIQEARFLRDEGQLEIGDRRRVEKLQEEIEELEEQLETLADTGVNESRTDIRVNEPSLLKPDLVEEVLADDHQPRDELLHQLLDHPEFRQYVQRELEILLYELGNDGRAAFRRGWGWKQVGSGGD